MKAAQKNWLGLDPDYLAGSIAFSSLALPSQRVGDLHWFHKFVEGPQQRPLMTYAVYNSLPEEEREITREKRER